MVGARCPLPLVHNIKEFTGATVKKRGEVIL